MTEVVREADVVVLEESRVLLEVDNDDFSFVLRIIVLESLILTIIDLVCQSRNLVPRILQIFLQSVGEVLNSLELLCEPIIFILLKFNLCLHLVNHSLEFSLAITDFVDSALLLLRLAFRI